MVCFFQFHSHNHIPCKHSVHISRKEGEKMPSGKEKNTAQGMYVPDRMGSQATTVCLLHTVPHCNFIYTSASSLADMSSFGEEMI